ncbi:hypothetical protein INT47_000321 [Mucor saturninus]|uniref:Uncharacterized protein n=1 Tax=Mucor saturninus TaxID=64648 RepID=A0A8H7USF6_9FUNG|nr:hypothetical protein INT47_000321 [Mucor saturninus]
MRLDDLSNIKNLGGFRYCPRNIDPATGILSMQAYCIFKQIQFQRNSNSDRQSKDFSPEQVYNNSSGIAPWLENFCRDLGLAETRSFGTRLEFRVSGPFADSLFQKLKDQATVAVVNTHARFFPSPVLFSFFSCRAKAFHTLLLALNNPVFKSSQEGLTLATVVSYLFSSILHRPMDTFSFKTIHRLVEDSRCSFSPVLFLSDLIRFDGVHCSISPPFLRSVLHKHFPLRIMASIPVGQVNVQVSETSFLGPEETYTLPASNVHLSQLKVILANLVPVTGYPGIDILVSNEVIGQSLFNHLSNKADFSVTSGIFLVGRFSPDSVRLFSQLLLSELVQTYSQWANRLLTMTQDELVNAGDRVFEGGFLEASMSPEHYQVNFARDTRRNMNEWLLPSVASIRSSTSDSYKSMAWLGRSSPWKKICSRGYYMTMVKNLNSNTNEDSHMHDMMETFRGQVLQYISDNYEVLPLLSKDKIWITRQKKLQFVFLREMN